MLVPEPYIITLKIGKTAIDWPVSDIRTMTINELADLVCSKNKNYEGLLLSFTFQTNAQKFEVSNGAALRNVLLVLISQKIG